MRDERADRAVSADRPAADRAAAERTPDSTYHQAKRPLAGMIRRTRLRRAASRVWDGLWCVPAVYVLVALGLSVGLVRWDETDPDRADQVVQRVECHVSALCAGQRHDRVHRFRHLGRLAAGPVRHRRVLAPLRGLVPP